MIDWQQRVQKIKGETFALYLAYKDPRVPWYARLWVAIVVAYALSPIDLIPDFIPIIGYLDDLVLIPLGILLAVKMIPDDVMAQCREKAKAELAEKRPVTRFGAVIIVTIWLFAAFLLVRIVVGIIQ